MYVKCKHSNNKENKRTSEKVFILFPQLCSTTVTTFYNINRLYQRQIEHCSVNISVASISGTSQFQSLHNISCVILKIFPHFEIYMYIGTYEIPNLFCKLFICCTLQILFCII